MDEAIDRLHDLVDQAARASQPEESLRALTALRAEVERAESAQAARALAGGSSYGMLARALSISRQAAHRRYRHLAGEGPAPEPPVRGRILITTEAREAVAHAREEAIALHARAIGSEHLLLGVLRCSKSPTHRALDELGVTLDAARSHAQPTAEAPLPGSERAAAPPQPKGITAYTQKVFDRSLEEAAVRGDGHVGVEHLLLAALADADGGASRTLVAIGVAPEAVVAALAGEVS